MGRNGGIGPLPRLVAAAAVGRAERQLYDCDRGRQTTGTGRAGAQLFWASCGGHWGASSVGNTCRRRSSCHCFRRRSPSATFRMLASTVLQVTSVPQIWHADRQALA